MSAVPAPSAGRRHRRLRRYGLQAAIVCVLLMVPALWSYVRALTGPGTDSWQERTVEWARERHLGPLVDHFERSWYAGHQAKVGGLPLAGSHLGIAAGPVPIPVTDRPPVTVAPAHDAVPSPTTSTAAPAPAPADRPEPLSTPAATPIAGEGQWSGVGPETNGRYGVYATFVRPDSVHTSVLDAVVYLDPTVVSLRQYPGVKIPGAPWDRPAHVESDRQPALIAAFEGGFRLQDSRGGMILGTRTLRSMRTGGATLVIDHNGVPNVGMWGRDFASTSDLDSARQNLDLIVDGGVVNPALATDPNRQWGFTGPANKDAVWRSGLGITAGGALVWAGGDGLTVESLAETLQRAGAVRAMQMDINHDWVQFNTYTTDAGGAVHGQLLLPAMRHTGDRYLTTDTRDFIAVFNRAG